jgi:alpha-D-ribose 1-methylphosphonate 5-triphosphate diphosphatase PhnM
VASLKSRTNASVLIQKYIAIRRNKEKEDSEKLHADMGHMVRTEEDSEVDLTSITESDTDQEIEVLSLLYHFISFKAYLLEMMEKYYTEKRSMTAEELVVSSDIHVKKL